VGKNKIERKRERKRGLKNKNISSERKEKTHRAKNYVQSR
jgi:hypothetical protein